MLNFVSSPHVNGIDLAAVSETIEAIQEDPGKAQATFEVTTRWAGQTRSESVVEAFTLGGERHERQHRILADEPCELLGTDSAPNPQELLMAAFNACIMVGYVANAALRGIRLDSVEIRTRGTLDLRGLRVALVQTRHERHHIDELGTLLAMEQGAGARVFPDEASALLWLRHGAD